MGIAALVCGIVSIVCSFTGLGAIAGVVLGIIAIILGIKTRKDPSMAGPATAGLVLGIIGTVLSGILFIACVACVGLAGMAGKGIMESPEVQDALKNSEELQKAAEGVKQALENL
jgi:phosphotransferase system  glucose/maltose/N-acetylglucosamine-specific IIC component